MSLVVGITEAQLCQAIGTVLTEILPANVPVVRLQVNRVPEVKAADWVGMTPMHRERLATNVDNSTDLAFTASIANTVMTVTAVEVGAIAPTASLFGENLAANTSVVNQISGTPGGAGTYTITPSQTAASGLVWGGVTQLAQNTELRVQLDVHGPNSAENAQIITTVFRDDYGVQLFADTNFPVTPLYCEDPKQIPFINEQQQVEERWVVDAVLQANLITTIPQQFADQLNLGLINVDVTYPP